MIKKDKLIFAVVFIILGLVLLQVPFTRLLGSRANFTLFDFFAPIIGSFTGTPAGIISVFIIQLVNFIIRGATLSDPGNVIRLIPTLFAVSYFAKKRFSNLVIPALAIIIFNSHPIGRSAWQYSLFWFIPIFSHFFRKNLFIRSLGSTFTAHAVGGALWVWTFGLSKELWLSLIPIVMTERMLFAGGMTIAYVLSVNILHYILKGNILTLKLKLEKQYILK